MPLPRPTARPTARQAALGAAVVACAGGLLLGADRLVAGLAAQRIAQRLTCLTAALPGAGSGAPAPDVRVAGFPVAAHLLDGTVGRLDASVVVPFGALPTQWRGRPVSYGSDDAGRVTVRTSAAGLPVTVVGRPRIDGTTLTITPEEVDVLGLRRPASALGATAAAAGVTRSLPTLPQGLTYRSVDAAPSGLRVTVTGHDVPLSAGNGGHGRCAAPAASGSVRSASAGERA